MERFVHFYCSLGWDVAYTSTRPPGGANVGLRNDRHRFNKTTSMNLEIRQQWSCTQVTFWSNTMIRYTKSAFLLDQSALNFCSTTTRLQRRNSQTSSPPYAAAVLRVVYESSFWTSKEEYKTSHNLRACFTTSPTSHYWLHEPINSNTRINKYRRLFAFQVYPVAWRRGVVVSGVRRMNEVN